MHVLEILLITVQRQSVKMVKPKAGIPHLFGRSLWVFVTTNDTFHIKNNTFIDYWRIEKSFLLQISAQNVTRPIAPVKSFQSPILKVCSDRCGCLNLNSMAGESLRLSACLFWLCCCSQKNTAVPPKMASLNHKLPAGLSGRVWEQKHSFPASTSGSKADFVCLSLGKQGSYQFWLSQAV